MSAPVPPEVASAAKVVDEWLRKQGAAPKLTANNMTAAERLDYVRQFPQEKMPPWRDPRS